MKVQILESEQATEPSVAAAVAKSVGDAQRIGNGLRDANQLAKQGTRPVYEDRPDECSLTWSIARREQEQGLDRIRAVI